MLPFLNEHENQVADFINEGTEYTRSADEIFLEFEMKGWGKGEIIKIIDKLSTEKPYVIKYSLRGKGQVIYTTTAVMARKVE